MGQVEVRHEGGVARVTLDRPPLNVIDVGFAGQMRSALEALATREDVAVVVLRAHGRAFSAGVDVRDHLPDRGAEMLHEFHRACLALLAIEAPVVAAVHAAALGGGCELTLCCDMVVAAEQATFALPEIRLGVFPPLAAMLLPRMVPPHIASEMILTGRALGAEEARQAGLVNRVASEGAFEAAVEQLVSELLALSPASLRLTKRALRFGLDFADPARIAASERFYVEHFLNAPDAIEGLNAFLEKRAPAWRLP